MLILCYAPINVLPHHPPQDHMGLYPDVKYPIDGQTEHVKSPNYKHECNMGI